MSMTEAISQRDLRLRSKQIMDAVEDGHSFTVTRGGHSIGELIPLRRPRTFVPREQFQAGHAGLSPLDLRRFRADIDGIIDSEADDPYER